MTFRGEISPVRVVKSYGRLGRAVRGGFFDFIHYRTERKRSRHFCFKYQGWGIDLTIFEDIKKLGIETFVLIETEAEQSFISTLDKWEKYATTDRLREDQNEQVFLEEWHWDRLE